MKWSRDRVIYFTLVTIHWVDASLGPVGFCMYTHVQITGAFQLACSGSPREATRWFMGKIDGKFQKIQRQVLAYTSTR